ncbi:MAG TPA: leucyl aminopeptidase [Bryobacteraceae bacterium]|nr:leucyl aminopeptidase [Bryobacteraceae bacterium]
MEIQLLSQPIENIEANALVVVAFDKESPGEGLGPAAKRADEMAGGWIREAYSTGEFSGKLLETSLFHRPQGLKASRLLLVGGGKAEKFTTAELRKLAGAVVRILKSKGSKDIAFALDGSTATASHVAATVEGALLGDFEPDRYKTEKKDQKTIARFSLAVPAVTEELEESLRRGRIIAESQNFTRDLVSEPANRLNPSILAERARLMAADYGLEYEVLDADRMRQVGMGALLGVAQGSSEPPALIILRYRPEGADHAAAHLGLVGKGVTFDTGGISIKPSEGMEKMKYDMAGGAAVLGAMRALAQLKPAIPVTALVPAVENMPGGRAQRPGDIVTTLSGKTVEVLNTDAEGRLILADAITYARRLGCTHLVDAATLTGAIVVALGHVNVGAFSTDDAFLGKVLDAAKNGGEKLWQMPLDDDYKESLKSAFADIPNIGNRWGGAITAAMFLKEFAEETPWVHLDIAGTAWLEEAKPFLAKGPSGVPLRTLVNLALSWRG